MHRIQIDVQTGIQTTVELTPAEVTAALAQKAAWDAEQAAIVTEPTLQEIVAQLQAEVALLKGTP